MVNIVNAVGSGTLNKELDLHQLADEIDEYDTVYDPEEHAGMYLRTGSDDPVVTIYRTGSYNISGAESVDQLLETNGWFLEYMTNIGVISSPDETEFSVRNMVCTADLGTSIDLNRLAVHLGFENTEYEPEQFPALIYRPVEYNVVFLLFSTGSTIVTGLNEVSYAESAFEMLKDEIVDFLE